MTDYREKCKEILGKNFSRYMINLTQELNKGSMNYYPIN